MKSIDGVEEKRKSFLTTIAIGQRFAGSYLLTPKAIVDDGLLDVCDIDPLTLIKRLIFFMKIPKGNHLGDPTVHYSTCENCIFEFQEEVPAHLDGELIFNKRFEVSLEEKCLNIMVF